MSAGSTTGGQRHLGGTMRRDAWWLELLPVIVLLGAFGVYATLRAFEGTYYEWGPYLSPFYSPLIDPHHRWWPFSPALLILIWPLGFRVTCYYYRKAYYRAFFLDPPACAVSEGGKHRYRGETAFPFMLQNLHRYFLYVGFIFLIFLWHDAFHAFFFDGRMGVGVGTLVLLFNVTLLTVYALSCHSLRHLVGGRARLLFLCGFRRAAPHDLAMVEHAERASHAVCLDQPDHGGSYRPLRSPGCQRRS